MNKQLYDIESQILELLENSTGNILDDTNLIDTLANAKKTGGEVNEKMAEAKITEAEIEERSEEYRPVAFRAALLYVGEACERASRSNTRKGNHYLCRSEACRYRFFTSI